MFSRSNTSDNLLFTFLGADMCYQCWLEVLLRLKIYFYIPNEWVSMHKKKLKNTKTPIITLRNSWDKHNFWPFLDPKYLQIVNKIDHNSVKEIDFFFVFHSFQNVSQQFGPKKSKQLFSRGGEVCISLTRTGPNFFSYLLPHKKPIKSNLQNKRIAIPINGLLWTKY